MLLQPRSIFYGAIIVTLVNLIILYHDYFVSKDIVSLNRLITLFKEPLGDSFSSDLGPTFLLLGA